jgi:hypothetical protein
MRLTEQFNNESKSPYCTLPFLNKAPSSYRVPVISFTLINKCPRDTKERRDVMRNYSREGDNTSG